MDHRPPYSREHAAHNHKFWVTPATSGGGRGVKIKAQIIGVGTSKLSVIGSLDEQVTVLVIELSMSPALLSQLQLIKASSSLRAECTRGVTALAVLTSGKGLGVTALAV
jgi:hypothetical protein